MPHTAMHWKRNPAAARRRLVMASARKKGPPMFGGPSLGRNAPRSKAPLEPVTSKNGRRLFPAVFTQKGKWLRDRFFGTKAVKSVHGIERPPRSAMPPIARGRGVSTSAFGFAQPERREAFAGPHIGQTVDRAIQLQLATVFATQPVGTGHRWRW
jgi:hypothetical protein